MILDPDTWRACAAAHRARLAPYVDPHLERRRQHRAHPVHDFLFTYYSHRPSALTRWHPGYGVVLAGADPAEFPRPYRIVPDDMAPGTLSEEPSRRGLSVAAEVVADRRELIDRIQRLLVATASRPPALGCFGMHEWAMVYDGGVGEEHRRHPWPLRLDQQDTDAVVESHRVGCSHFDAFRFFTPAARGLNTLRPGRDDREAFEQPGCLHAGMDLYKHAFRLSPLVPSELVADCFALAWDIRVLDMRAAPYDLSGLTLDPGGEPWTPVRVETPEGKQEYVAAQRAFAERAAPLRRRLIEECERLASRSTGRGLHRDATSVGRRDSEHGPVDRADGPLR